MNEHPSPLSRMDAEGPSSPKRKKMRQKYAPKACVSCRRSKLKCTGENPCQRCLDNNKRCFYSEDQTAAEALQNLSRPGAVPHAQANHVNGALSARRSVLPRHEGPERRPSDASALGTTMEARMARMEAMMETLIHLTKANVEQEDVASDVLRSDTAFSMPVLDPIHPALDQIQHASPDSAVHSHPGKATSSLGNFEPNHYIRLGQRTLPFPGPEQYQCYMAHFFGDIHIRYPCLHEPVFRERVDCILVSGVDHTNDVCFLALAYIIFACCDIGLEPTSSISHEKFRRPGWTWFRISEGLINKSLLLTGCDDIAFVQMLLFQAIYLALCDLPALAYNSVKLACTAAIQQDLHRGHCHSDSKPEDSYWRICLFWSLYCTDWSVSVSCERFPPSHLPTHNISGSAAVYYDEVMLPNHYPPDESKVLINQYQIFRMWWVGLMEKTLEEVGEEQIALDPEHNEPKLIETFLSDADALRMLSLRPPESMHLHYNSFRHLHATNALLILGRRMLYSPKFDSDHVSLFRNLALQSVEQIRSLHREKLKGFGLLQQMTSAAVSSVIVLGSLLTRSTFPDTRYEMDMEAFKHACSILSAFSTEAPYARRAYNDCQPFMASIMNLLDQYYTLPGERRSVQNWQSLISSVQGNIRALVPYQSPSASLGVVFDAAQGLDSVENDTGGRGDGVLWLL